MGGMVLECRYVILAFHRARSVGRHVSVGNKDGARTGCQRRQRTLGVLFLMQMHGSVVAAWDARAGRPLRGKTCSTAFGGMQARQQGRGMRCTKGLREPERVGGLSGPLPRPVTTSSTASTRHRRQPGSRKGVRTLGAYSYTVAENKYVFDGHQDTTSMTCQEYT